jgi:hypothetical protein
MISKISKTLGIQNVNNTLFKKPNSITGKNICHFNVSVPNSVHQCDLLILPEDSGYNFALVVVDVYSGKTQALPSKGRTAQEILTLMKKIYDSNVLTLPETIQCDNGSEFKGVFKKYFESKNVKIRYGKVGRHKNQAYVESRNFTIGKILFEYMTAIESITGQPNLDWIDVLPVVITEINKLVKPKKQPNYKNKIPYENKSDLDVLDIGQKVRVKLDSPKEFINDEKLHGTFRAGDIRWSSDTYKITNTIMQPNRPILYVLNNKMFPAYNRNELQIVSHDDDEPDGEKLIIKNKTNRTYIIKDIIERKKESNRVFYKVLWKGFKTPSWETRVDLIKTNKDLIIEYEKN